MKRILAIALSLFASVALAATTLPVQLLNPTGSTSGQAVLSTGPSSAPAWGTPSTPAAGGLLNVQVFTSSGTYTPTTGTTSVVVYGAGGGGGGGGAAATTAAQIAAAGPGAGGSFGTARITSISSQTVTIGALGAGGSAGANAGSPGGQTSIGTWLICPGGGGGTAGTAGAFAAATEIGTPGTPGAIATSSGSLLYASKGMTGSYAIGQYAGSGITLGIGGSSPFGAGGIAALTGAGAAGSGNGSGGSGAFSFTSASQTAGGNGTGGIVIIFEYR